jgi:hypothetical protein
MPVASSPLLLRSSLSPALPSRGTFRLRLLLGRLFWAIVLLAGLWYAIRIMGAEKFYVLGMKAGDTKSQVDYFRIAEQLNPFDVFIRGQTARAYAVTALRWNDKNWLILARGELLQAIKRDTTSADLIQKLIIVDLRLNNISEAQMFLGLFMKLDPKSDLSKAVMQAKAALAK